MRSACIVTALASAALAALPSGAVTTPSSGASAAPAELALSWPFPAGERVSLLSGYGPYGGSSLHDGTTRTGSANDYYALDLTLDAHANHGKGEPVLAAADGVVVKAGWASGGWANYGQRVLLEHDPGDGHSYVTMYAHLDRIDVVEGDTVTKGQPIGALGQSCQGALSCSSFGTPHLHFAVHRDSSIGGSGSGGSYGGNAVVPELIDGAGDLEPGQVHTSANTGGPPPPPPPPNPACALVGDAELVLEEDGPCAHASGPAEYWHVEGGHGGASRWTYAIDAAAPDNALAWTLSLDEPAAVELSTAVPALATSEAARYRIVGVDVAVEVVIDQRAHAGGQVVLATVEAAAGELSVLLADNTGEAYIDAGTAKKLAFDAIIVRRAVEEPPPEEPPPEEPPPEEPPPEEPPPEEPPPEEPPPGVHERPPLEPSVSLGCTGTPGVALAPIVVLLAWRRRRR
ncbi:MAG: M23 family metallopeptidase [Deltaproteobacteria bacterium]|nr:M23 family metallopeptidase [Deltaproteobacteria bacterium]